MNMNVYLRNAADERQEGPGLKPIAQNATAGIKEFSHRGESTSRCLEDRRADLVQHVVLIVLHILCCDIIRHEIGGKQVLLNIVHLPFIGLGDLIQDIAPILHDRVGCLAGSHDATPNRRFDIVVGPDLAEQWNICQVAAEPFERKGDHWRRITGFDVLVTGCGLADAVVDMTSEQRRNGVGGGVVYDIGELVFREAQLILQQIVDVEIIAFRAADNDLRTFLRSVDRIGESCVFRLFAF